MSRGAYAQEATVGILRKLKLAVREYLKLIKLKGGGDFHFSTQCSSYIISLSSPFQLSFDRHAGPTPSNNILVMDSGKVIVLSLDSVCHISRRLPSPNLEGEFETSDSDIFRRNRLPSCVVSKRVGSQNYVGDSLLAMEYLYPTT